MKYHPLDFQPPPTKSQLARLSRRAKWHTLKPQLVWFGGWLIAWVIGIATAVVMFEIVKHFNTK